MRPPHKKAHPECVYGSTTWGDCDKHTDNHHADWEAFQQVLLAYRIVVVKDRASAYRREKSQFAQLVLYISGERDEMLNSDGNPSQSPWVLRLRAAIERFKSGNFPSYNLYRIPTPPGDG